MQLDLRKDENQIRRFIKERIRNYPVHVNLGPGEDADPIRMVTVGYHLEQAGHVALVFDTRPDADVDGEWTSHLENDVNVLSLPTWRQAYEVLFKEEAVFAVLSDGSSRIFTNGNDVGEFVVTVGEMLKSIMIRMRDEGGFNPRGRSVLQHRRVQRPMGLAEAAKPEATWLAGPKMTPDERIPDSSAGTTGIVLA
jgi:hypothetical protein